MTLFYEPPPKKKKVVLGFTYAAWTHLVYLCEACPTEIGCFGVAADPEKPLLVTELHVPTQETTAGSTYFDAESIAEMADTLSDRGLRPVQFQRIFIHTHPGGSAEPTRADEETFDDPQFSDSPWAVMMILSRDGKRYARIRTGKGNTPVLEQLLDVVVLPLKDSVEDGSLVQCAYWPDDLKKTRPPAPKPVPAPVVTEGGWRVYTGFEEWTAGAPSRDDLTAKDPTGQALRTLVPLHAADAVVDEYRRANGARQPKTSTPAGPTLPMSKSARKKFKKWARNLAKANTAAVVEERQVVVECDECSRWVLASDTDDDGLCLACHLESEVECRHCSESEFEGLVRDGLCLECQAKSENVDEAEIERREEEFNEKFAVASELGDLFHRHYDDAHPEPAPGHSE